MATKVGLPYYDRIEKEPEWDWKSLPNFSAPVEIESWFARNVDPITGDYLKLKKDKLDSKNPNHVMMIRFRINDAKVKVAPSKKLEALNSVKGFTKCIEVIDGDHFRLKPNTILTKVGDECVFSIKA
ncbi:MAG TPA: hypothetical protein PKZ69_08710 [Candidatus Cloacimonadota bacterium]|nr:hypothetical protein [Candidatus Cloacimonadota bacterium]